MHPENAVDVIVLTALAEECDAFLRYVEEAERVEHNSGAFHRATIGNAKIILLAMHGMGNVRSAAVVQRAIAAWNPAHIVLTGITGGVRKATERILGDILIPEQVVDYEYGKTRPGESQHRWQVYRPDPGLLRTAKDLSPAFWVPKIKAPRPDGSTGRTNPLVHFGPLLSGQKVVTDPELVRELNDVWVEATGIEMEAIGVALATYVSETAPGFLVVKGISDWADPEKGASWRAYAAEAAASLVVTLVEMLQPDSSAESRTQAVRRDRRPAAYQGKIKVDVCQRLVKDWRNLSDYFDIPDYQRARFHPPGYEPHELWEWLESREKLGELEDALAAIGRRDLAKVLHDSPW